jgi:protein-S-isoprenylcysteine O-methyltransferase Ste14
MIRQITNITEVLLAMSGIIVRRLTFWRGLSILLSAVLYLNLLRWNSVELAIWYFIAATLIHYVLLFGVFAGSGGGWRKTLIDKYGEEQGYLIYEAWMAFVFFHNGTSTGYICSVASPSWLSLGLSNVSEYVLIGSGIVLSMIGLPVKVWSTLIVGIDTYYYKDLFLRRPVAEFKVAGPYKILKNPMYGVGHFYGYGTALLAGSAIGILAVAFNQCLVWSFYFLVERPHVREVYGQH